MKLLTLAVCLFFLGSGLASAQELFPLQAVPVTGGGCTPAGSPCPVGVTAPAGFHFDLTFDDEFTKDASIDPNKWNVCDPNFLTLDGTNGVGIVGEFGDAVRGCLSNDGMPWQGQIYGYWEYKAKYPHDYSGEGDNYHSDIFYRALTQPGPSGQSTGYEDDICEIFGQGVGQQNYCGHTLFDTNTVSPDLSCNFPFISGTLADNFNVYGWWWKNDGTPHGTEQVYFNGASQCQPYSYQNPLWSNGFNIHISEDATTPPTNPFYLQYVRQWQLVPN